MAGEESLPFIRNLASSDRKLRTQSLESLHTFLTSRTSTRPLTNTDAEKLWTGLFYALWMADRPLPQQALCNELAALVLPTCTPRVSTLAFLDGFWKVVSKRWTDIDVLRMEKFLLLVRRVLAAHFKLVVLGSFRDEDVNKGITRLLRDWPFDHEGDFIRIPVGLRLHVLDIWVDELEREGILDTISSEGESGKAAVFVRGIADVVSSLTKEFGNRAVRERAAGSVEDERLDVVFGGRKEERERKAAEEEEEEDWGGFED